MSLDKILNFVVEAARREERRVNPPEAKQPAYFAFTRKARDLVGAAKGREKHHRERETHYTGLLEIAETKLRAEGLTVEVIDPSTGFAMNVGSGSIGSGQINFGGSASPPSHSSMPKFQAKINQDLLGIVEKAKTKMLEHRAAALKFGKYARAFACCPPDHEVLLSVEDVHEFQLET